MSRRGEARRAIGLMSGTSIDGVDGVLLAFNAGNDKPGLKIEASCAHAHPPELRQRLLALSTQNQAVTLCELASLDAALGEVFADAAAELIRSSGLSSAQIEAIGSHGQTLFHDPEHAHNSLQLGDPNRIAARTGITTVADFRRADLAAGGQGAPLVPAFHHAAFARADEALAVVNIGGIANITLLPDAELAHVRGYDTGPGNALMDEWASRCLDAPFDHNGDWAAGGQLNAPVLEALLGDPWFAQAPPKSTGRDQFNLDWAGRRIPALETLPAQDVQRSFCELTAAAIAQAAHTAKRLLVCGGGARNALLMERLRANFSGPVETTARYGLAPQWVEAAAFAWLALQRLTEQPGNVPTVTGARRPCVLGAIYAANRN